MCEILSFYINIFLFVLLMLLYRINWKNEREMDCGFVHGGTVRSYNKLRRA